MRFELFTLKKVIASDTKVFSFLKEESRSSSIEDPKSELLRAISKGDERGAIYLLVYHDDLLNCSLVYGLTPLLLAASSGQTKLIKYLLDSGVDVNQVDSTGHAALHVASVKGHQKVVEYVLITKGNKINKEHLNSALFMAAAEGYVKIVNQLLKAGANPNYKY